MYRKKFDHASLHITKDFIVRDDECANAEAKLRFGIYDERFLPWRDMVRALLE